MYGDEDYQHDDDNCAISAALLRQAIRSALACIAPSKQCTDLNIFANININISWPAQQPPFKQCNDLNMAPGKQGISKNYNEEKS